VEWPAVKYFGDSRKAPPGALNSLTMSDHHPYGSAHHTHQQGDAGSRLVLALGFAAVKAGNGFWSASPALLGDTGHMLIESASL